MSHLVVAARTVIVREALPSDQVVAGAPEAGFVEVPGPPGLEVGAVTTWTVHETIRKVYVARIAD